METHDFSFGFVRLQIEQGLGGMNPELRDLFIILSVSQYFALIYRIIISRISQKLHEQISLNNFKKCIFLFSCVH